MIVIIFRSVHIIFLVINPLTQTFFKSRRTPDIGYQLVNVHFITENKAALVRRVIILRKGIVRSPARSLIVNNACLIYIHELKILAV